MELVGILSVFVIFFTHVNCQGFADLPMLPQNHSERTFLYLVPPVGEPRLNKDTACTVVNTQERETSLLISVKDFDCVRECNWKIKVYVNGCPRREFCCEKDYNHTIINHNFLLETSDFTTSDVVYIVHNNIHSDANGSRLKILVHGYLPFSPTTTPGPAVEPQMETKCGLEPWSLLYKKDHECPTPPSTVFVPIVGMSSSSSPSTQTTATTTSTMTTTMTTRPAASQTTTQTDSVQEFFSIDTNKYAVIGGAVAAFVVILIIVIICAVCLARKGRKRREKSKASSLDAAGEMESVYSYARTIPQLTPAPAAALPPSKKDKKKDKKKKEAASPVNTYNTYIHESNIAGDNSPPKPNGIIGAATSVDNPLFDNPAFSPDNPPPPPSSIGADEKDEFLWNWSKSTDKIVEPVPAPDYDVESLYARSSKVKRPMGGGNMPAMPAIQESPYAHYHRQIDDSFSFINEEPY